VFIFSICAGLAKRVGAKVLIASTSEVYGDPEVHPQPETYWGHVNPIGKTTVTCSFCCCSTVHFDKYQSFL
jgi:nucleoside-diphosphate-sugar epimerase